jgi:ABC-type branched-subunit amino acid transport system substrate-binding protein
MITPGEWETLFGPPPADAGQLRVPEQDELQALAESADEGLKEAYSWEETMKVTRRQFSAGLAAGIAVPALLHTAPAQGATIKIGMVVPITGPAAESGAYALTGTRIALDKINKAGGVLGKQVELVTEDDQSTNPGAVLAFSKLATQSEFIAFLGPIRSTAVHAIQPDLLKVKEWS